MVTRYCPAGSALFQVVDRGYYTTGGTETTRESQTICPPGSFCNGNGYAQPCPAGLYGSEFGLTSETCTGSCLAGYYCPAGSMSPTSMVSARLLSGMVPSRCCDAMWWGQACGSSAVFCKANASEPTPVTVGYYSIPVSVSELYRTDQASCEPGSFCMDGVKVSAGRVVSVAVIVVLSAGACTLAVSLCRWPVECG
jgi:hypothetical protein